MKIGMLWFDNSKADLVDKIRKASEYYQAKYKKVPTLCFVHPTMLVDGMERVGTVVVQGTRQVLPNHFWIGVGEQGGS